MKITRDDILHVAHLARLEIDAASVEKFAGQIGQILEYVEQLRQVDTAGVKATSHAIALTNVFREDAGRGHLEPEEALANAPLQEDGSFVVPKVVG
jgi:aspartyl-tRNA(Asn)/glutamyl-tRNA(Gln) amidotransferase subunit C